MGDSNSENNGSKAVQSDALHVEGDSLNLSADLDLDLDLDLESPQTQSKRYEAEGPLPPAYSRKDSNTPPRAAKDDEAGEDDLSRAFASDDPLAFGIELGDEDVPEVGLEAGFDPWSSFGEDDSRPSPAKGVGEVSDHALEPVESSAIDEISLDFDVDFEGDASLSPSGDEVALGDFFTDDNAIEIETVEDGASQGLADATGRMSENTIASYAKASRATSVDEFDDIIGELDVELPPWAKFKAEVEESEGTFSDFSSVDFLHTQATMVNLAVVGVADAAETAALPEDVAAEDTAETAAVYADTAETEAVPTDQDDSLEFGVTLENDTSKMFTDQGSSDDESDHSGDGTSGDDEGKTAEVDVSAIMGLKGRQRDEKKHTDKTLEVDVSAMAEDASRERQSKKVTAQQFGILRKSRPRSLSSRSIPVRRTTDGEEKMGAPAGSLPETPEPFNLEDYEGNDTDLLRRAQLMHKLSRHGEVELLLRRVLQSDPSNHDAQQLKALNDISLEEALFKKLGDLDAQPKLAITQRELMEVDIDSRGAFLLSRVDGTSSMRDLIELSPMSRIESARAFVKFLGEGIIMIRQKTEMGR